MMHHLIDIQVLHVVFDRYHELSVKSACCVQRANGVSRVYKLTPDCPLPKQSVVLTVTANKRQIIKMSIDELCKQDVSAGKKRIVTGPDAYPVDVCGGIQLESVTHEEADIIMIYDAINEAVAGYQSIKVVSDDVMCL